MEEPTMAENRVVRVGLTKGKTAIIDPGDAEEILGAGKVEQREVGLLVCGEGAVGGRERHGGFNAQTNHAAAT
jgi:hypothetical protein